MNPFLKSLILLLQPVFFLSHSVGEEIKQDFNSRSDFNSFWDISTWGNSEQQYSKSNVSLDTAKGWVRLKINASPKGKIPVNGEIMSKRNNFLFGSYRAAIKFDNIPGGVVGWFVYRTTDDLHEIDVEYLTQDIKNIHFTLHHIQTSVDYKKRAISFDPTADFHEYRFDWYAGKVVYFIDGKKVDSLTNKVPDAACSILLNFWSANNPEWGGPAPTEDAYMYVDYMHYYSDPSIATELSDIDYFKSGKPSIVSGNKKFIFIQNGHPDVGNDNLSIYNLLGRRAYHSATANNSISTSTVIMYPAGYQDGTSIHK
jgi:beta-glucanase (GH16 family)